MISTRDACDPPATDDVVYPSGDGQPIAENTRQFAWIVTLKENIDAIRPDDFVAGDLLWYPVEGHVEIRVAPDVLVVPGRPKGHRGSYIQHREGGVPPKVVIEVLSPSNSAAEMMRKTFFYQHHGADELIIVDPDTEDGAAYVRNEHGNFAVTPSLDGWTSPFLGVRFARTDGQLAVFRPDGTRFRTFAELEAQVREAAQRADEAAQRADEAAQRAERLAAKLRELGVDPDA